MRKSQSYAPTLIRHDQVAWEEVHRRPRRCIIVYGRASAATLASMSIWRWLHMDNFSGQLNRAPLKQRLSIIDRKSYSRNECNCRAGSISFRAHSMRQRPRVEERLPIRAVAVNISESSWIEALALMTANRYSQWRRPSSMRHVAPLARQSSWYRVKDWARAKHITKSISTIKMWAGSEPSSRIEERGIFRRAWQRRRPSRKSSCTTWSKWMMRKPTIKRRPCERRHIESSSCWRCSEKRLVPVSVRSLLSNQVNPTKCCQRWQNKPGD